MAYVKNCNPGKIAMDLPWKNYIYELPLFSFGDLYGNLALSLVFNHSMKVEGTNSYFIAEGYKLNVNKRIVIEGSVPVAVQEANGNLIYLEGEDGVYMLTDESQRVLRTSGTSYILENPDFSYERYNNIGNIVSSTDKYGSLLLNYLYSTEKKLISIVYRNSKTIDFTYSSNQLSKITYASNVITLAYASSSSSSSSSHVVTVGHYSGETFTLSYTRSGSTAEPDVISTFCATENSSSNSVKAERENDSFVITELIDGDSVDTTTYNIHFGTGTTQNQVEITNNESVKTRIQYDWKYPLCAYEINDDAEFFDDSGTLKNRFKGSVQMMSMQGLPTNNRSAGLQTAIDGTSFGSFDGNGQLDMDVSSDSSSSGYYIVSGWIKANTSVGNPITQVNIGVGTSTSALIHYPVDLTPVGQWKFFSCMVYAPANSIVVTTGDPNLNTEGGNIYTEDWRLSYLRTGTYVDKEPVYTNMKEYVLTNGTFEIPFREAKFKVFFSESEPSETTEITPMDVLKYKLTKKAHGTQTEAFYQNCKNVSCNATGISVLYNDNSYNIFSFDVAVKTYDKDNVYLKRIRLQESTSTANIIVQNYMNGAEKSVQTYNHYFDLISATENGISTTFTRNARGLVTRESVGSLYSRSTAYGTDGTTVTVTDEYGDTTIYTLDSVWGVVKSITLPDESVVTDTYDDDMCARVKRTFSTASGRSNNFTYSDGNLTGLNSGNLDYSFTYTAGKLTGVSKDGASVEKHVHTGNTKTESYYPAKTGALYSDVARFDKYGRLSAIDDVLTNVYQLRLAYKPSSNSNTWSTVVKNGSALLSKTTDEICGELSKFVYDHKERLVKKTITNTSNSDEVCTEEFGYDDIDRTTSHAINFPNATFEEISESVGYKYAATNPAADNTVSNCTFRIGGDTKAYTVNTTDNYHRVTQKKIKVGTKEVTKTFGYDVHRVTQIADGYVTRSYAYDNMGRIQSVGSTDNSGAYYTYDQYGQLVREDNVSLDKTFIYEYNNNGNITSVKAYNYTQDDEPSGTPTTTTFGYNTTYPDRLTSFGGTTITYNSIGCPTSYDGKSATWTRGKLSRLSSGTLASGTSNYTYNYNAFGQRVSKSYSYLEGTSGLNPVQTGQVTAYSKKYYYDHAGRLLAEGITKTVHGTGTVNENIVFLYDESGMVGMEYTVGSTSTLYYFQRNLQGDVTGIYNTSGNLVAKYLYDAWGNCTISSETTNTAVANANPIRYRGYYYDEDTGLYYCNARYYSSKWRRFISPDDTAYLNPESVNGLNLYCYCGNDPVNYVDPSGHAIETVFDIISLGASIVDVAVNPLDPWAWLGLVGDVADIALLGVGGLGEAVRVLKAMGAIDDTVDVVKITKNTLEVISTTANALSVGGDFLYVAYGDGAKTVLEYVGITNDFNRRKNEWALKREIFKRIEGVDRNTTRCAEQTLISLFGKKGNTLSNIRNSIGKNGKLVDEYIAFFKLFI